jgi:phosphoribosylformylglycinamidine cyclo-ligase
MKYKDSGVDVEAGYRAVELMKKHVNKTLTPNVIGGIGSFGGLYALDVKDMKSPVLVSGTDGVGTKLRFAFIADRHDTIGIDCVAMCVNDIMCSGAVPLFFLDYIACGKNYPEKIEQIVKGVAEGCIQAECALIGGETAEMPGFYDYDEYDIAGFAVGIVERDKIIDGSKITEGDALIGLASSGLHSNGFSLIRKAVGENQERLNQKIDDFKGSILDELLTPTKIYVKTLKSVLSRYEVKGIAHITGGGFYENIPRILPEGYTANVKKATWPILPIFHLINNAGMIPEDEMYRTFNMGIGMVLAVGSDIADELTSFINTRTDSRAYIIGEIGKGEESIKLW